MWGRRGRLALRVLRGGGGKERGGSWCWQAEGVMLTLDSEVKHIDGGLSSYSSCLLTFFLWELSQGEEGLAAWK